MGKGAVAGHACRATDEELSKSIDLANNSHATALQERSDWLSATVGIVSIDRASARYYFLNDIGNRLSFLRVAN